MSALKLSKKPGDMQVEDVNAFCPLESQNSRVKGLGYITCKKCYYRSIAYWHPSPVVYVIATVVWDDASSHSCILKPPIVVNLNPGWHP